MLIEPFGGFFFDVSTLFFVKGRISKIYCSAAAFWFVYIGLSSCWCYDAILCLINSRILNVQSALMQLNDEFIQQFSLPQYGHGTIWMCTDVCKTYLDF